MAKGNVILLVEDDPSDEALTLRSLRKNRILNEVVVAHDGVEALDFFSGTGRFAGRDTDDLPVMTLLDLKLPKVDGMEVLRRLRSMEKTRFLPVVILTASRNEKDISESDDLHVIQYLQKPIDLQGLAEVTRALGMHWVLMDEMTTERGPHVGTQ
ncbi:MAG: response regulator [Planctomycetes bacterium]|nr:response regulator [Planctomycetota bacterium]